MKRFIKFLDSHLEEYLMAILLVVLTSVMFLQIVMRFVFDHAFSWPEELSRYCFVYITFLTLGFCTRRNSMLKLDILETILPKPVWTILQIIVRVVTFVFFLYMFRNSLDLLATVMKTSRTSTALKIPYTYIYLSTVIGFGLGLIRSVQMLILPLLQRKKTDEKEEENV